MRSRSRVDGRRMADSNCQHKHVHLRNSSGVHLDGNCGDEEDERVHRQGLHQWRFHPRSRYITYFLVMAYVIVTIIFIVGGSISNLYAFLAARHKMFPEYKEKGLLPINAQLVMFTSDQCHYSIKSCASVCGLGTDHCVEVPSDER